MKVSKCPSAQCYYRTGTLQEIRAYKRNNEELSGDHLGPLAVGLRVVSRGTENSFRAKLTQRSSSTTGTS